MHGQPRSRRCRGTARRCSGAVCGLERKGPQRLPRPAQDCPHGHRHPPPLHVRLCRVGMVPLRRQFRRLLLCRPWQAAPAPRPVVLHVPLLLPQRLLHAALLRAQGPPRLLHRPAPAARAAAHGLPLRRRPDRGRPDAGRGRPRLHLPARPRSVLVHRVVAAAQRRVRRDRRSAPTRGAETRTRPPRGLGRPARHAAGAAARPAAGWQLRLHANHHRLAPFRPCLLLRRHRGLPVPLARRAARHIREGVGVGRLGRVWPDHFWRECRQHSRDPAAAAQFDRLLPERNLSDARLRRRRRPRLRRRHPHRVGRALRGRGRLQRGVVGRDARPLPPLVGAILAAAARARPERVRGVSRPSAARSAPDRPLHRPDAGHRRRDRLPAKGLLIRVAARIGLARARLGDRDLRLDRDDLAGRRRPPPPARLPPGAVSGCRSVSRLDEPCTLYSMRGGQRGVGVRPRRPFASCSSFVPSSPRPSVSRGVVGMPCKSRAPGIEGMYEKKCSV
mmetsp:Transcript_50288/g.162946  ORF Transcript_50288/g.162946 Transcript_50288/m.162946 type:complete len:503 (+) Transcript_50288:236-1744(+)